MFTVTRRWTHPPPLRQPDLPRPFRTPGYPIVPAIYLAGTGLLTAAVFYERPVVSLSISLLSIAVGIPVYYVPAPPPPATAAPPRDPTDDRAGDAPVGRGRRIETGIPGGRDPRCPGHRNGAPRCTWHPGLPSPENLARLRPRGWERQRPAPARTSPASSGQSRAAPNPIARSRGPGRVAAGRGVGLSARDDPADREHQRVGAGHHDPGRERQRHRDDDDRRRSGGADPARRLPRATDFGGRSGVPVPLPEPDR